MFTVKILLYAGNFWISSPLILIMLGIIYFLLSKWPEQSAGNWSLVLSTKATAYTNNTLKKFNKLFNISVLYLYNIFLHSPLGLILLHSPKAPCFVTLHLKCGTPDYDPYKGDFTKDKPTSSKGSTVRVEKESDHDLKKPDRKGNEYDPYRAETDSLADSVRNNPSIPKSNTESSLPKSTSHGTISEEEQKKMFIQGSKDLHEYNQEPSSTSPEELKKYMAEGKPPKSSISKITEEEWKGFGVFFISCNYRSTGFLPFIYRLWSIIRTSLAVFEPFIPYFISALWAIICPWFAVVEPFIEGWRLYTKLKKLYNWFIIIYKYIINNRIKYTSYIYLKFRIIKSNYLYLILVIIIFICFFFLDNRYVEKDYLCFCANITVLNLNDEPSKVISKVSKGENQKTISKSYCGPCKDNTSRDKRQNQKSIFYLNDKLKRSHSIVTTPNQELPFVSEHRPHHKKFLNKYDFGYCLSGLFEGNGSLDRDFQITLSKKNIAFVYEVKKTMGYGSVFSNEEHMFYKSGKGTLKFFSLIEDKLVSNYVNLIMKEYFTDHPTYNCDYACTYDTNAKIEPIIECISDNPTSNYWLAGFTQASGFFHTSVVKSKRAKLGYRVKLEYCLKHSNKGYLDYVYNYFSMGKVYWDFYLKIWVYKISSFKQAGLLISYFDKFNVFAQKYVEYVKYRKVYLIVLNNKHLTKKGLNKIISIANKGSSETSTH